MRPPSTLNDYLFRYTNTPEADDRAAIDADIWKTFGTTGAVFVLDMAGFSQTCQERGIVYYLAMVHRMQTIVSPIVERYDGAVVKFEADNCFARFPDTEQAIDAAIGIQIATDAANRTSNEDIDIRLSIGIDYGDFLLVDDHDFFGNAVNCASKLGEDIAESGELLVTQNAMDRLPAPLRFTVQARQYTISNITLDACLILR